MFQTFHRFATFQSLKFTEPIAAVPNVSSHPVVRAVQNVHAIFKAHFDLLRILKTFKRSRRLRPQTGGISSAGGIQVKLEPNCLCRIGRRLEFASRAQLKIAKHESVLSVKLSM
jgi:hypothetical protein